MDVWRLEAPTEFYVMTAPDVVTAQAVFLSAHGVKTPAEYYRRTGVDLQTLTILRLTDKGRRELAWSDPDLPEVRVLNDLLRAFPELHRSPSYIGSREW